MINGASIRIGRIFGIGIYLHISWLIIFALVTISLASYFRTAAPHWLAVEHWLFAILTSLLFFTSVLLHELSHSLVARRKGIEVRSITLFLFGGMAAIEQEATRPRDELEIAAAGPLASFALGGLFYLIHYLVFSINQYIAIASIWLASINLGVAIFNLLPAYPMDGGRMLRSLLWWRSGNMLRATRTVGWLSSALAAAFIGGGLLVLTIGGEVFSGIWLALIGWFLWNIARSSVKQNEIHEALHGLRAQDVMETDLPMVASTLTVRDFAENFLMRASRRAFLVLAGDHAVGLVTRQHLKRLPSELWERTPLSEIMTKYDELIYTLPDAPIDALFDYMAQRHAAFALVLAGQEILGLVARDRLLQFIEQRLDRAA